MNQTGILQDMAVIYTLITAILTYAWIRGIVEPTPAALELLQQARDDYNSWEAQQIRQRAADRAAYDNQVAAARRIQARQWRQIDTVLHRDGTDGVA